MVGEPVGGTGFLRTARANNVLSPVGTLAHLVRLPDLVAFVSEVPTGIRPLAKGEAISQCVPPWDGVVHHPWGNRPIREVLIVWNRGLPWLFVWLKDASTRSAVKAAMMGQ